MFSLDITIFYISSRCTLGEVRQYTTARPPGNTTFVCFQHRNRKLFCVVRAHHLLQHCNDLAERWPCPFGVCTGRLLTSLSNRSFIVPSDTRWGVYISVSYTHLRAHETDSYLVCRLL